MNAVTLGAILFSVLLLLVAVMILQEVRRAPESSAVYIIDEVVPFVFRRLSDAAMTRLDEDDVQRVMEWEVYYLQGLGGDESPVAGSDAAVAHIRERAAAAGNFYTAEDVGEVLGHEAAYLLEIGAVGSPVTGEVLS